MNAIIPMNLLGRKGVEPTADFVHTGIWSGKSLDEAGKYGKVNVAASSSGISFRNVPGEDEWRLTGQCRLRAYLFE